MTKIIAISFVCGALVALCLCAAIYRYARGNAPEPAAAPEGKDRPRHLATVTPAPAAPPADTKASAPDKAAEEAVAEASAVAEKDAIGRIEADVLQSLVVSEEMQAKVDETRTAIEAAFAAFDASTGDAEAESKLVRALSSVNPTLLLSTIHDMMRTGDAKTRTTALTALQAVYSSSESPLASDRGGVEVTATTEDAPSPNAGDEKSAEEAEKMAAKDEGMGSTVGESADEVAMRTRLLVESVAAGLADGDAGVKDAAFETMMSLPDEATGILASQILSGTDDALKHQLLTAAGDSTDPANLQINLQAMSGEDDDARQLAADNLESALGERFTSVEEATAWIENNAANQPAPEDGSAATE